MIPPRGTTARAFAELEVVVRRAVRRDGRHALHDLGLVWFGMLVGALAAVFGK